MKKTYETPEIEIMVFQSEDILLLSNVGKTDYDNDKSVDDLF